MCNFSVISEFDDTSAGLILASWMWLKLEIDRSKILSSDEKSSVIAKMTLRTRNFVEPHQLVSWILDPRSRGCGLNRSGRRLVRDLGRKLYCNMYPEKSESSVNELIKEWIAYDSKTGM